MNERRYAAAVERLRSPQRVALLEIQRVADLLLGDITAHSALDVGVGSGLFAEEFAKRGLEVAGVDVNPEMVEASGQFVPGGSFQQAPAEQLPYPNHSFDVVFLGHVLHETDDPVRALSEARRVARLRVAVFEWPYQDEAQGPPLVHRLKPEQIETFAQAAGLMTVENLPLSHMALYRMNVTP